MLVELNGIKKQQLQETRFKFIIIELIYYC